MNDDWEGTEYTICPSCQQVVLRESLKNHTHICRRYLNFMNSPPIGDM